jgi:hypothetical protein
MLSILKENGMFIKNKYTKWYFLLIENAKNRVLDENEYYEKHHVIPKSMGGNNFKENLITLTAREHFVCHLLLLKMVESFDHKRSMAHAIFSMNLSYGGQRKKLISSREFELARKIAKEYVSGKNNGFYDKGHLIAGNKNPMYKKPCYYRMSESEKQQWKDNISKGITGEKNPFYGKNHSEEIKKMLSEKRSIPIKVTFNDGTVAEFSQYKYLGTYLGKSEHLGCKLCKEKHFYLHKKYGIKNIEKLKENTHEKNEN